MAELKAEGLYNDEPIGFMGPRGTYNEDVRINQAVTAYLQEAGINAVSEVVGPYDQGGEVWGQKVRLGPGSVAACRWLW